MPSVSVGGDYVGSSYATSAELSRIPTAGLRDGDQAYCTTPNQYWRLAKSSTMPVGAYSAYADIALNDPAKAGRWILIGSGTILGEVVNAAALVSVSTAGLPLGSQIWIDSYRTWARLDSTANAGAVVADEVFASDSASFRWVRMTTPLRSWSGQLAWQLDAVAGNNENSGAPGFPLLNVDELARRLPTLPAGVNYTFDFIGNVPSTSRLNWAPTFTDAATGLGFSQRGTLLFRGTRTTTRSGTITAATQTSAVAQASATDPGVADWTADIGRLIVMTGGAQAGESAWIGANLGANVARVSSWCTAVGTQVGVVPALGTYDVQTLSQWACEGMIMVPQSACIVGFENFEFVSPNNAVLYLNLSGAQLTMVRCKWSAPAASSPPIACANAQLWRSSCLSGVGSTAASPRGYQLGGPSVTQLTMSAGSMILNSSLEIITGARFTTQSDVLFQGSRLQVANVGADAVFTASAAAIIGGNTAFYDWASDGSNPARDAAIAVLGNGYVGIYGNVFGTSAVASTYGVRVEAGGVLQIATQALATCTLAGAAAAIRFDDPGVGAAVGTAIPPFVPGAVVPALQPLTTWANWTGAPFSGNASSYRGTRIIGTG